MREPKENHGEVDHHREETPRRPAVEAIVNLLVWTLDAVLLGFIAYGGYLVLGAGFHPAAQEDAARSHVDVGEEPHLHHGS